MSTTSDKGNIVEKKGSLFIFEGPDNVGKSTAINELSIKLNSRNVSHVCFAFPGKQAGTLGKHIYDLHHNPKLFGVENINPLSLQLLHISAHIDAIYRDIIPALNAGKIVLLDRYWWSTYVYGMLGNIDNNLLLNIIDLENKCWDKYKPDIIFLLNRVQPHTRGNTNLLKLTNEYEKLALIESEKSFTTIKHINNNDNNSDQLVVNLFTDITDYLQNKKKIKRETENLPSNKSSLFVSNVLIKRQLPKITNVYDTYWKFATERQEIFFKRLNGKSEPWTNDSILSKYKFTNVYRASDRVSQYLIRKVIYNKKHTIDDLFFRILLFKTFNKIETWELIENVLGDINCETYSFTTIDQLLMQQLNLKKPIYSAAYIMASGRSAFGLVKKHQNHLRLLENMMKNELPKKITEQKTMQDVYELLLSYPTIGSFLAYQYCIDINYSELTNFSEMEFIIPGPGAKDGIKKCFSDLGDFNEKDIIKYMAEQQEAEFLRLNVQFKSLWGRRLQLIDCQNLFCEVDKYSRVAHPEIKGISDRSRIKQIFKTTGDHIRYWYPPKWGINSKIQNG